MADGPAYKCSLSAYEYNFVDFGGLASHLGRDSVFSQGINSENKFLMQIRIVKDTRLQKKPQKLQVKAKA